MKATLFQTDKSVKILVFGEEEFSFDIDEKKLGKQLKNDITYCGVISETSDSQKSIISTVKPDIVIDLMDPPTIDATYDVTNGRLIPIIKNVDAKSLQSYHKIFLLIDQIKQIKSQLKLD